ncbi:ABC transporter substrate-binding protein [Haloarchaeobius amylolyticus]|uniref:ABC transporter substrate-binding protein n=1 Tax=Haloarchaeobius amylolyticus TaxID=1198296 RepID=UPI002271C729|nr:ABC transporter substrate-binding protein [Haloarchaeobius amylolyticus]
MPEDSDGLDRPTRRDCLRYGGTVVGTGLLAGCSSNGGGGTDSTSTGAPAETTEKPAETATESSTQSTETESFEVTVKPYGSTTFERPPETYATSGGVWTDIGFAFGTEPTAMSRIDAYPTHYYDRLPGVTFDAGEITNLGGPSEYSKEQFYELDVDALLLDRVLLNSYAGWDADDFEEVGENVAPFCGTYLRNEWSGSALGMEFSFPYYTLTEAVKLTGRLFQDHDRADAWVSLHESFRRDLQDRAPAASPSIGLLYSASQPAQGKFMVTDPTLDGIATRQYRTFGVEDAFSDVDLTNGWKTDYEGLLEADPDYLFFDSTLSMSRSEFETQFVTPLEESEVGSELSAVEAGRVYRGGGRYQGPILNLFQTEILAKQLYPETFGAFSTLDDLGTGEQLFDRQRVADIIDGDF